MGCASATIFNLCAQLMNMKIKENESISGINIGSANQVISQYADDTDLFAEHSQQNLDAIVDELERFHLQSGLTVNYEKTAIYRIGSIRNSNAQLYTQKPLAWTNIGLNVLGIFVTHDDHSLHKENYEPMLQKIKNRLVHWSKRRLTVMGKVTVINTLIASLFVHKMMVLPTIKDELIQQIEAEFARFIWNGKKSNISMKKLQRSKREGGLQLVNIQNKDKGLKISWIQILNSDPKCAEIAFSILAPELRALIFKTVLKRKDVVLVCPKQRSAFWHDVLIAWSEYAYCKQGDNFANQVLWWNSEIRINGSPVFWKKAWSKGLV